MVGPTRPRKSASTRLFYASNSKTTRLADKLNWNDGVHWFGAYGMGAARETSEEGGATLHPFLITSGFGLPVCRLGLASYGRTAITPDDVLSAVDRGVNFLNIGVEPRLFRKVVRR